MEKRWIWPFELEEQIGAGAMGVVYRARFVKNDRRVALKLLPADIAANGTLAARFQREMELLKELRHPHIVHCFGGTCEGDHQFYAMELIEGGTLATLIEEQGRLPWRQAVEFGLQICAALDHAHERQIIHRDLKPGNLLVTKAGRLKLSDFGLAQMVTETKLTAAGKTVGSLHYMAPEQIQGKPALSNRTDLYALGCVLYEMLTGRPPFLGGAMAEVLQRHIRETPAPVSSIAFDCPPPLEALVMELLSKDPDQRPQDARSVARRLRDIDQGVTIKMPRFDRNKPMHSALGTETVSTEIPAPPAANPWAIAGLVVVSLGGGWLGSLFLRPSDQGGAAQARLIAGLQDAQPAVRVFAAQSLGESGVDSHDVVAALIGKLSDDDPQVRTAAIRALGKFTASDDAMLALRKIEREEPQPTVREAAAEAQALIRDRPHAPSYFWVVFGLSLLALAIGGGAAWAWRKAAAE
ncbi:MAG TPA: protein kinase [Planctomycetaceae bacterium]|nr:protein kinase [Planctomycetaceae bacterium]